MIRLVLVIQVNFLLKDREWISDEEVRYVLSQQLVNSYTQEADYSSLYIRLLVDFYCDISHLFHIFLLMTA